MVNHLVTYESGPNVTTVRVLAKDEAEAEEIALYSYRSLGTMAKVISVEVEDRRKKV